MTSLPRTPLQRRLLVLLGLVAAFAVTSRISDSFTHCDRYEHRGHAHHERFGPPMPPMPPAPPAPPMAPPPPPPPPPAPPSF